MEITSERPAAASSSNGDGISALRAEIDGYLQEIRLFERMEPAEIFLRISAISARLIELRVKLLRAAARTADRLRREEIDPLLDELERQFRLHSRVQAVRKDEWDMAKGAP